MENHASLFAIAPRIFRVPENDPLLAPEAKEPATEVLEALASPLGTDGLPFIVTNWDHLSDSGSGVACPVTLDVLASWVKEKGSLVKIKTQAEIFGAFTTKDGSRREDAVQTVNALVLDCDGGGDWEQLHSALSKLGFGFLLYQSPSHTPELPKWRCLIPFDRPFEVRTPDDRARWKICTL